MSRPLIGVSTGFTDYGDYLGVALARPLTAAGAVPVVVPYLEDAGDRAALLERLDGLLIGPGRDIHPSRYGGARHPTSTEHSPLRDAVELALVLEALDAGVPLLGICRGMQVLNVALGGTLHADHSVLPPPADRHPGGDWATWDRFVEAALTGQEPPEPPAHPIAIEPDSRLAEALGTHAVVNSFHHQSIDRPGRGVRVVARAPDGVVEAIEVPDAPALALGVQWELQEGWRDNAGEAAVFGILAREAARARLAAA